MASEGNTYVVPISIIIAGALIALAVYFGGGVDTKSDDQQNDDNVTQELSIDKIAENLGIDKKDYEDCRDSEETIAKVDEDMEEAFKAGARGTPFSVLITKEGNKLPISGAVPADDMDTLIGAILSGEFDEWQEVDVRAVDENDHIRGSADASIVIVEYSDFECTFCISFHATMKGIMDKYGADNDVAWVYRHLPLEQLHPNAKTIAQASECVSELGGTDKFWEFADLVVAQ